MTINNKLKKLYSPYLAKLKIVTKDVPDKFSYPLLMNVFPEYEQVKTKILFVGKESYDDSNLNNADELTVQYLMRLYRDFEFGKTYYGRNSPFWRFVRKVYTAINPSAPANGFMWTNISKCNTNGKTPEYKFQRMNDAGFDLIKEEINILEPDIVLFLTGWKYEYQFQRIFSGLNYETVEENYIYKCKCKHSLLPKKTFMTMHPKGLSMRKQFDRTIEIIYELCK